MSQQIQISGGAKVRDLQDVIIGSSGVLSSLAFDVANGVPKLDSNGKILVSQLPNSVMEYKGTWNAATNTPTLANGTGNQGDVYLCNVAGTVDFGAGPIAFVVGDQVIYSGSIWQRASGATGTVTSVAITESGDSLNITGSPITTSGTINIGFNGTNLQYVNGAGNLTTFPILTGYVPYTGATANVDLGTFNLTADVITGATGSFASSGGSDTFAINHSSGAGIALNITKGGNGEGLYINKTSGSGNAATIIGTLNATTLVKSGGTSSQFLKADGTVDSTAYQSALTLTTTGTSGAATLVGATLNIPQYQAAGTYVTSVTASAPLSSSGSTNPNITITQVSSTVDGYLSFSDYNVFSGKISGSGTAGYITRYTGSGSTIGNSGLYDDGTTVSLISRALSGSSASFSSTLTSGDIFYLGTGGLGGGYWTWNATDSYIYSPATKALHLYVNDTTTNGLTIAVGGASTFSSSVTATSFVKTGGTSAQFLKADGSVDSSTYLTTSSAASTYLPLAGGTLTGALGGTSATFSGKVGIGATPYASTTAIIRAVSATSTNYALIIEDNASNQLFEIKNNGAATFSSSVNIGTRTASPNRNLNIYAATNDNAIIKLDANDGNGYGAQIDYISKTTGGTTNTWTVGTGVTQGANSFEFFNGTSAIMALTIGGNVGIGTSSPDRTLTVNGSIGLNGDFVSTKGGTTFRIGYDAYVGNSAVNLFSESAVPLAFGTNATERMRLTSDGNLLLGTTDNGSGAKLVFFSTTAAQQIKAAGTAPAITFSNTITSPTIGGVLGAATGANQFVTGTASGDMVLANQFNTGALIFGTSNTERMRITSGGNVLIGTTTDTYGSKLTGLLNDNGYVTTAIKQGTFGAAFLARVDNTNSDYVRFFYTSANTQTGSINTNGTTTTYNVTSDYRLKQDLKDYSGLDLISSIKTYDYEWKSDKSRMYGVVAHELQEVIPYAVQGEKDGLDENNKEKMQSVDYSKLVPILVKAIQELKAEIETLKIK
jgi:hypothetical protein